MRGQTCTRRKGKSSYQFAGRVAPLQLTLLLLLECVSVMQTTPSFNSYTGLKFLSTTIVKLARHNEVVEYSSGLKSDRRDYGKEYFNVQPENRPADILQDICLSSFFRKQWDNAYGNIDIGIVTKSKYWEQSRSWRECDKALLKKQKNILYFRCFMLGGPWQCKLFCFALIHTPCMSYVS